MRPDCRTSFLLRHVGAALRRSPVRNLVGIYVASDGALRVVMRKFITPGQHNALVGMCTRLLRDAEKSWEAMAAPQG